MFQQFSDSLKFRGGGGNSPILFPRPRLVAYVQETRQQANRCKVIGNSGQWAYTPVSTVKTQTDICPSYTLCGFFVDKS